MDLSPSDFGEPSRLRLRLDHFSLIDDPRDPRYVAFPMAELLLLAVCGTIADCDDYEAIALWGEEHLDFLRRFLPFHHGVPSGRWLTIMMNRVEPALFSTCFTSWVRPAGPIVPRWLPSMARPPGAVTIARKDIRRSILVSAFATTSGLVLGQEAVADTSNEITAIPILLERLAANDGLKGALVTIDAIACNATIATAVRAAGADYLLAVKANQPGLSREIELVFEDAAQTSVERFEDVDKGHGRIETRTVSLAREVDWLDGSRRFPGELRLPHVAAIIKVESKTELKDRCRFETRYYITSASLDSATAAMAIRSHWRIENQLHWVLDVVFGEDQSRLRKGNGAKNMAVVRHFAFNQIRIAARPSVPSAVVSGARATHQAQNIVRQASSSDGKSPDGASNTSKPSSVQNDVNRDSEPCAPIPRQRVQVNGLSR